MIMNVKYDHECKINCTKITNGITALQANLQLFKGLYTGVTSADLISFQ